MEEAKSPAKKIALLLSDVDGTLVTKDKVLTERSIKAVQQLNEAGVKFAITSGRPAKGMQMLINPLHLTTPIAGFNGGTFVLPDHTMLGEKILSKTAVQKTMEIVLKYGLDLWLYSGNDWYVRKREAPHVDREVFTVKFEPIVVPDFDDFHTEVIKVVGVSDEFDRVEECETALQQALGDSALATRSQPYYVDITNPDANKGGVLKMLSNYLSIDPSEIATIGDGPNDVLMFKLAGMSIAMGNAIDKVKHSATHVTDSNDQEGFANAVERFILPALVPTRS
jgi:Cof subfamily protein (haloacid dehalogenase superfamily)